MYNLIGLEGLMCHQRKFNVIEKTFNIFFFFIF
jgi:hypothetical protein